MIFEFQTKIHGFKALRMSRAIYGDPSLKKRSQFEKTGKTKILIRREIS